MKLVISSDIHGNHDALRARPEDYDELWVLGDLVTYGTGCDCAAILCRTGRFGPEIGSGMWHIPVIGYIPKVRMCHIAVTGKRYVPRKCAALATSVAHLRGPMCSGGENVPHFRGQFGICAADLCRTRRCRRKTAAHSDAPDRQFHEMCRTFCPEQGGFGPAPVPAARAALRPDRNAGMTCEASKSPVFLRVLGPWEDRNYLLFCSSSALSTRWPGAALHQAIGLALHTISH